MKRIVVADIFGITDALQQLCVDLGGDCIIIDAYGGKKNLFQCEDEAYRYFTDNCSLDSYANLLIEAIDALAYDVELIGFSIGASAIWQASNTLQADVVKQAWGFYGSQIRHMIDKPIGFPVTLILPHFERHFSIADLRKQLMTIDAVTVIDSPYGHGFMNHLSENFDARGYEIFLHKIHHALTQTL